MTYQSVGPVRFEPVTNVTATNSTEVGTRCTENGVEYVYVYNDGGSSILSGYGAVLQSGASGMSVTVSSVTSADFCVGVAVNTLTTATYGWLATRGIVAIEAGTTIASRGNFELGGNGTFDPHSNTSGGTLPGAISPFVGQALAEIVTGASGNAYISCL